ncbi:signal peptidase I [Christensenellaceae bacterium OttesenSCG-928-L17]|nr:signal peptidase I [Christensenellaceae bacterium OttesenSCG-928-L17]
MASISAHDKRNLKKAAEILHDADRDYRRASNFDFFVLLLLVVLVALSVREFIAEPFRVDGPSMYPTLVDGERMVVEKLSYTVREPRHGEIIVCYYPGYTVSCVKRVIGVPGDTVSIIDGRLYINGVELDESDYWNDYIHGGIVPHIVPEGSVFVVGDNRNRSTDSRNPDIGDIPYHKIEGRVVAVAWPVEVARRV